MNYDRFDDDHGRAGVEEEYPQNYECSGGCDLHCDGDAAIARAEKAEAWIEAQANVLREAEHSLITLSGLWATDLPDAYNEALRDGLDANAAQGCVNEATWQIDEISVIQHIKSVLATTPDPTPTEERTA